MNMLAFSPRGIVFYDEYIPVPRKTTRGHDFYLAQTMFDPSWNVSGASNVLSFLQTKSSYKHGNTQSHGSVEGATDDPNSCYEVISSVLFSTLHADYGIGRITVYRHPLFSVNQNREPVLNIGQ